MARGNILDAVQAGAAEPSDRIGTGLVPPDGWAPPPWILADAVFRSSWDLPPVEETVPLARRLVGEACVGYGLGELAGDVALLTSELVTNAVRHACDSIGLRIGPHRGGVVVAVSDDSDVMPVMQEVEKLGERGRGMRLVDALAVEWGIERRGCPGKTVWFHLSAAGAGLTGAGAQ